MDHLLWWIYSGAGVLIGAAAAGLLAWIRMRHIQERQRCSADAETALLKGKIEFQQQALQELNARLARAEEEALRQQQRSAELLAANAALQAHVQRIPAIEKQLALGQEQCDRLQAELRRESAALAQAVEKTAHLSVLENEKAQKEEQLSLLQQDLARRGAELAELRTALGEERKQAGEKLAMLADARDQLRAEFQNLANRIFEEKSVKFVDQNRTAVNHLLSPLREQIGDFKQRVEEVYDRELHQRSALQAEIHHLKELNQRIAQEALNLTRALKGDSKTRGNWGEVVLERVLEASGLQKGREYDVQVSLLDAGGRRYQPDVVVRLPEGKHIIIDAKVSLKAYEAFYCCEDPAEKEAHLQAHIESMRMHIRGLTAKSYQALEGVCSLDFTLIFIPIEAAFLAAMERDSSLFLEAFEKNILLVSPSTLLVTLRTIQNIWRHEHQNNNALEIARKAGALYDKFVGFVDALEEIGRQLDKAREAYLAAYGRLVNGRGNLLRRSQELKELGVKAGKELPLKMLEQAGEEN